MLNIEKVTKISEINFVIKKNYIKKVPNFCTKNV